MNAHFPMIAARPGAAALDHAVANAGPAPHDRPAPRGARALRFASRMLVSAALAILAAAGPSVARSPAYAGDRAAPAEVRGTWLTTTANDAIAGPTQTAESMRRLRAIGLNTVYVETWKNGYTQFPSQVLLRTIGVDRRPALVPQDPSDDPSRLKQGGRDLLEETLIEAHRHQLLYMAWFEYGFMAAHKSTDNHLRRMKREWISLDAQGNDVAPNGFVWMNPLHPEARRFLLDLVLEAIDRYDLDGVQLDDRIVWPYVTMGYDDYTKKIYAAEHDGAMPPEDHKDPAWMRWRAEKVNEYARQFVEEVRAARPGILVSLSPAPYPWCYEHYLLEWPMWSAWKPGNTDGAGGVGRWWDEFIPQCYRMNYPAFEKTWLEQVELMKTLGGHRVSDLIAGIRVVGDGPDSTWEDLEKSIELVRQTGGGGHVLWFSRGVLDVYPEQLTGFYQVQKDGFAPHPKFPANWRPAPVVLSRVESDPRDDAAKQRSRWKLDAGDPPDGAYRVIVRARGDDGTLGPWTQRQTTVIKGPHAATGWMIELESDAGAVELLVDRRPDYARRRVE